MPLPIKNGTYIRIYMKHLKYLINNNDENTFTEKETHVAYLPFNNEIFEYAYTVYTHTQNYNV